MVKVKKEKKKYRVVEEDGSIAMNPFDDPYDAGGHSLKVNAQRQAKNINARREYDNRQPRGRSYVCEDSLHELEGNNIVQNNQTVTSVLHKYGMAPGQTVDSGCHGS